MKGTAETEQKQLEQTMSDLVDALSKHEFMWESIDVHHIQQLTESLLKIYAVKMQSLDLEREGREQMTPLPQHTQLTPTEAVIFADKLLEMMDIDLFEVQMFRSFSLNR